MDEAIRLLGSFAKYVQQEEPELSPKFLRLAMAWAARNQLPLHKLAQAMAEQASKGDGSCTP